MKSAPLCTFLSDYINIIEFYLNTLDFVAGESALDGCAEDNRRSQDIIDGNISIYVHKHNFDFS